MKSLSRLLPALFILAATASAGEPATFREAARDFVRSPSPWSESRKQEQLRELAGKAADAPVAWIEEIVAAAASESIERYLTNITPGIFEGRAGELKPLVAKLLKDGAEPKLRLGASIAFACHFDVDLAELIMPLFAREDSTSPIARDCFRQCKDNRIADLLIAVADTQGKGSGYALNALGCCDAPKAQVYLRRIAADRTAPEMRRREALEGLSPLEEEQDLKIVRDAVEQERDWILYAAVCSLHQSNVTADLESLRRARKRIPENGLWYLTHLLCAAGDAEAFESSVSHSSAEPNGSRTDADWAIRSPLPGRIPRILKALETEPDDWCCRTYLVALGEGGDVACLKPLVACLGARQLDQEAIAALVAVLDRYPKELRGVLESILELGEPCPRLVKFHDAWIKHQAGGLAAFNVEGHYMVLLRANIHDAPKRIALCETMEALASVTIGNRVSDLKKWESWWDSECAKNKTE